MDAVMKILKEIERQAEASRQMQAPPEIAEKDVKRKRKRKQAEVEPQPVAVVEEQSPPPAASPIEEAQSGWSRQRIIDALQLSIALGPPPGLDGW